MRRTIESYLRNSSKMEISWILLCSSLAFLIWATFLDIVEIQNEFGRLNLYAAHPGVWGSLFLASSIVEFGAVLIKFEKIFIPLRVVNSIWLSNMLKLQMEAYKDYLNFESSFNLGTKIIEGLTSWFTDDLFAIPAREASNMFILGGYTIIRFGMFLSFITMAIYLYFRVIKKESLHSIPNITLVSVQSFFVALNKDKIITLASCLLLVSPFIKFINWFGLMKSAFGANPIFALTISLLAYLIILNLSQNKEKNVNILSLLELLTFIFWNPLFVLKHGMFGLGYIIYIIGLSLLASHIVRRRFMN